MWALARQSRSPCGVPANRARWATAAPVGKEGRRHPQLYQEAGEAAAAVDDAHSCVPEELGPEDGGEGRASLVPRAEAAPLIAPA